MIGKTPGNIVAVRPLKEGVISDYETTERMLKYFIKKAMGSHPLAKPTIAVCVPSAITEVEKRAVEDATRQAGARKVHIIEEPIEYKKKFSLVKQNLDRNLTFKKLTSVIVKISHLKQTIG